MKKVLVVIGIILSAVATLGVVKVWKDEYALDFLLQDAREKR